jgi:mannose-6-phosphate isomerase-like protein (cupin superfamily)
MALDNYIVFTKPNKWLESKYARPYYLIYDKRTGEKHKVSASELWNSPHRLTEFFGKDTLPLAAEIIRREREIETLKDQYIDLYMATKHRYDEGIAIPKTWLHELEDIFDQMFHKDVQLGDFSPEEEDTLEAASQRQKFREKAVPIEWGKWRKDPEFPGGLTRDSVEGPLIEGRSPEIEAPHYTHMPNIGRVTTAMDKNTVKLARKCEFLLNLEKENETFTAGPVGVRSVGYVNPMYEAPLFARKKKKGKKEKQFMKADGFVEDIEEMTNSNEDFRRVLYTGKHSQLVLMKLKPGEEIGEEVHEGTDQFFRVDSGMGMVIIDGKKYSINDGAGIVVPAGAKHNVVNVSKDKDLKLYTIYSPPEHQDQIVRQTKEEAEQKKEEFDGKTTE